MKDAELKRLQIENALLRHATATGKRLDPIDLQNYAALAEADATVSSDGQVHFAHKPIDQYITEKSGQSKAWGAFAEMPNHDAQQQPVEIPLNQIGKLDRAQLELVRKGELKVAGYGDTGA